VEEEFFNCQTREEINKEKASSISKEFILARVIPFTLLLAAQPLSPSLSIIYLFTAPPARLVNNYFTYRQLWGLLYHCAPVTYFFPPAFSSYLIELIFLEWKKDLSKAAEDNARHFHTIEYKHK